MSKIGKIIKKMMLYFIYAFLTFIMGMIFFRFYTLNVPKDMLSLDENQIVASALSQGELKLLTQSREQSITRDGKFQVSNTIFIPSLKQIQVTQRYNTSTLNYLLEDFDLTELPNRSSDIFDYTLVVVKGKEKTRYHASSETKKEYFMYNYSKLIFDNVEYEDADYIFIDFYYKGDLNYEATAYGTLLLYDASYEFENIEELQ